MNKKLIKKLSMLLLVVLLVGTLTACGEKQTFVNIGTGGTSGTYFPLGGAFAEIWNANIEGINATATSTGASVANVNLLKTGEVESVIIQNDVAFYAESGTVLFTEKISDIRGAACLYSEPLQCISIDGSVKSISDLKGKKVAVGAIGSGVEANARQIIAAAGLDFDKDIDAKFLSFAEAATALKDKQIDAAFLVAGIPTAAITDLGTQRDVFVVPIDGTTAENLMKDYSFYTEYIIPANTYKGQTEDIKTLTVKSMLAVSSKLSEDVVYNMLKSLYENGERVTAAHNVGKFIVKETGLEGMSITLHPGAEKYFKEIGLIK